jgi:hypothetical protein
MDLGFDPEGDIVPSLVRNRRVARTRPRGRVEVRLLNGRMAAA